MVSRSYGQYCGFARALELVGERWALLIVRDLMLAGKRFGELQRGLPKMPSNILANRLKELESSGIVCRRVQSLPHSGVVYELTDDGRGLEAAVIALGRWGALHLGDMRPGEIVTDDSMAMALKTIFRPESTVAHEDAAFELRLGDIVLGAHVRNGAVSVTKGALTAPDLVIESGPAIRKLLAREIKPKEALRSGALNIRGKRALLDRFVALFRI